MKKWLLGCLVFTWTALCVAQELPVRVAFVNPGYHDEKFWSVYDRHMHKAANDLGIEFKSYFAQRSIEGQQQRVREILSSKPLPDYLILTNEHYTAPDFLRQLEPTGIKVFLLHSTLNPEQQRRLGGSREKYQHWIGSLVPNDEEAGYLMAQGLIALANGEPAQLLAFTGVKQTPNAMQRLEGLRRALEQAPNVQKVQALFGEWSQQRAYEQARVLLPRYPQVSLIWSANDEMAFGVMQAAEELGRDLAYTGLNNSERVFQARADGRIDVLATGHFLLGACALVMLFDHSQGLDFAERGGKDQISNLLRLVDGPQAQKLKQELAQDALDIDFKQFSAVNNPQSSRYNCSLDPLFN